MDAREREKHSHHLVFSSPLICVWSAIAIGHVLVIHNPDASMTRWCHMHDSVSIWPHDATLTIRLGNNNKIITNIETLLSNEKLRCHVQLDRAPHTARLARLINTTIAPHHNILSNSCVDFCDKSKSSRKLQFKYNNDIIIMEPKLVRRITWVDIWWLPYACRLLFVWYGWKEKPHWDYNITFGYCPFVLRIMRVFIAG